MAPGSRRGGGKAETVDKKVECDAAPHEDDSPVQEHEEVFPDCGGHASSAHLLYSALCFLTTFTVYYLTLYPSVPGGDSGELIIVAQNFGAAHPPGYPTFTIINHLFLKLPLPGCVAWRLNLFSAMTSAGAAFMISLLVSRFTGEGWAGYFSGCLYGFMPTVWLYSLQAEVFSLNNFLTSMVLYLTLCYHDTRKMRYAYLGALWSGIGLTNQHTLVFYVVPAVLSVMVVGWRSVFRPGPFLFLSFLAILGMSPYYQLVIAGHNEVIDSWGDARTLDGFLTHFFRKEYGTFQLGKDSNEGQNQFIPRLGYYSRNALFETFGIGCALAFIGACAAIFGGEKRRRILAVVYLICYSAYTFAFQYLANLPLNDFMLGVQCRFWPQSNIIVCIFAGHGLFTVWGWLAPEEGEAADTIKNERRPNAPAPSERRVNTFIIAVVILFVAMQIGILYPQQDRSDRTEIVNFGRAILRGLPKNALVLIGGDIYHNAAKYVHQCEGYRPDVMLLSIELMTYDWFLQTQRRHFKGVVFPNKVYHPHKPHGFSMAQFLDANYDRFNIFLGYWWKTGDPSHEYMYETLPIGYINQVKRKDRPFAYEKWIKMTNERLRSHIALTLDQNLYEKDSWEKTIIDNAIGSKMMVANALATHLSQQMGANLDARSRKKYWKMAATLYEEYLGIVGIPDPIKTLRDAGIAYGTLASMETKADKIQELEVKMLDVWRIYCDYEPEDTEIASLLKARVNPYRRQ